MGETYGGSGGDSKNLWKLVCLLPLSFSPLLIFLFSLLSFFFLHSLLSLFFSLSLLFLFHAFVCSFQQLGKVAYDSSVKLAKDTHVPVFGMNVWKVGEDFVGYASNLTYTFLNFFNRWHRDRDQNDYTFGIWYPVWLHSMFLYLTSFLYYCAFFE